MPEESVQPDMGPQAFEWSPIRSLLVASAVASLGLTTASGQIVAATIVGEVATAEDLERASALGKLEAEQAILRRAPRILCIGYRFAICPALDEETGLLYESIGCIHTPSRGAYVAGWNSTVLDAASTGRLEGMTLIDRVVTLDKLKAAFEKGTPERLPGYAHLPIFLDERFVISSQPLGTDPRGRLITILDRRGLSPLWQFSAWRETEAHFFTLHEGATVVVRIDLQDWVQWTTVDLANAITLQEFRER